MPDPMPPSWFDGLTGGEMPPEVAAALALDDFAGTLRLAPRWKLETGPGGILTASIRIHRAGRRLDILLELAGENLEIALEPDPSGWLSITARGGVGEIFRARLDRPYEEYEFWPHGIAIPEPRSIEAPGRIGKRRDWINLSLAAWPHLARFANGAGVVALSLMDEQDDLRRP